MSKSPPAPRKHIPAIMPYPPGKPIEEVEREYGLVSVIKLASNENPLGPSKKAIRAMREAADQMHLYPDGFGYYLKKAISKKYRVRIDRIVLANGSDEISDMIAVAYLNKSDQVIFSEHDFISYKLAAMSAGCRFTEVSLKNWRVDLDGILRAISPKTKLICLANPSNPIGSMIGRVEFEAFIRKVPPRVLVLLDEAYAEYVSTRSYPNGLRYLQQYPNLIVARTFSKAYGLAGLRVGYGFADADIIRNFDRVRPPFNVNRMAQAAALAALEDTAHVKRSAEMNRRGMKVLEAGFRRLGLEWIPSKANFILVDCQIAAGPIVESLLRQGVIVRPVGLYGLGNHIRITVGRASENRRVLAALGKTLKKLKVKS